jgi:hypothetical protein
MAKCKIKVFFRDKKQDKDYSMEDRVYELDLGDLRPDSKIDHPELNHDFGHPDGITKWEILSLYEANEVQTVNWGYAKSITIKPWAHH